jgi:hypothetical protein
MAIVEDAAGSKCESGLTNIILEAGLDIQPTGKTGMRCGGEVHALRSLDSSEACWGV